MNLDTISVLDHGYLKFIESWGSDERIIESARMSTGKGFLGWGPKCSKCGITKSALYEAGVLSQPWDVASCTHEWISGDEKLLSYLYSHKHSTPFEMSGMTIEVQAPIFVFREWHRHRTQSYNEMSARYTPLPDLDYIPTIERLLLQSAGNKQASSTGAVLDRENAEVYLRDLQDVYYVQQRLYLGALSCGVPKELARIHLPVGRYSRMRASANLRNWLAFLTLRMAPNAQFEIQEYARGVGKFISEIFPRTWELFAKEQTQ